MYFQNICYYFKYKLEFAVKNKVIQPNGRIFFSQRPFVISSNRRKKSYNLFKGWKEQGRYPEESVRFPDEQASNDSGVYIMQNTIRGNISAVKKRKIKLYEAK